jgi:hypothetical protein
MCQRVNFFAPELAKIPVNGLLLGKVKVNQLKPKLLKNSPLGIRRWCPCKQIVVNVWVVR